MTLLEVSLWMAPWIGFGRTFADSLWYCEFEKADEESKGIFSNSVTLSEKLELDLQKDKFTDLRAVQHE